MYTTASSIKYALNFVASPIVNVFISTSFFLGISPGTRQKWIYIFYVKAATDTFAATEAAISLRAFAQAESC